MLLQLPEADLSRRLLENRITLNVVTIFDHQLQKAIVMITVKNHWLIINGDYAGVGVTLGTDGWKLHHILPRSMVVNLTLQIVETRQAASPN